MLAAARIKVEGGRIRHVATCVIGNDGDVVADLVLVRVAFERIKEIGYRHVRRPGHAGIRAPGIE